MTTPSKDLSRIEWSQLKSKEFRRAAWLKNDPEVYVPSGTWTSEESLEFNVNLQARARFGAGILALLGLYFVGYPFP